MNREIKGRGLLGRRGLLDKYKQERGRLHGRGDDDVASAAELVGQAAARACEEGDRGAGGGYNHTTVA